MVNKKITERSVQRVSSFPGLPISSFYARLMVVGVIVVGGAIFIGKSDNGEINVAATIQNSNQENTESGSSVENVATVPEAFRNMPNGGLVPQDGSQPAPAPAPEPTPEESASTTDEVTEAETEEGGEATTEENTEEGTTGN